MNKDFRLPDVGEGLTEADIVSWHVKPGDTVTINQVIVEIETAKAVVELPSPYAGTVSALLVTEGQTVDVGIPIITIDVPVAGEAPAAEAAPAEAEAQPPPPAAQQRARPACPPAGSGRVRRQAGLDQPPAAQERADPAGLLPGIARCADERGRSPPRDRASRASRADLAAARPRFPRRPEQDLPGQAAGATARPGPRHRPHRANRQRA